LQLAFQGARLIAAILKFKELLDKEQLPVETMRSDDGKPIPLCMNQFTTIFTTARIPGSNYDELLNVKPSNKVSKTNFVNNKYV
jgi:hypothetical protein